MKSRLLLFLVAVLLASGLRARSAEEWFRLGEDHLAGRGVEIDRLYAYACFHQAEKAGRKTAQLRKRKILEGLEPHEVFDLGVEIAKGAGVPADMDEALELFRHSQDQGYEFAHLGLAYALTEPGRTEAEFEEGLELLRRAVKEGDYPLLERKLKRIQSGGRASEREAAEAGDVQAQLRYAQMLEYGSKDVPRNFEEALHYYRMAADQGSGAACYHLGLAYANGNRGAPKDPDLAETWMTKAQEAGDPNAIRWMKEHHPTKVVQRPRAPVVPTMPAREAPQRGWSAWDWMRRQRILLDQRDWKAGLRRR